MVIFVTLLRDVCDIIKSGDFKFGTSLNLVLCDIFKHLFYKSLNLLSNSSECYNLY